MMLNLSHSNKMYIMAFKKHHMMIMHKNRSHLERKQKDLHLLLKNDPKLFWKRFEEKVNLTFSLKPQEVIDYCTKLYTSSQSINGYFVPTIQLLHVLKKGEIEAHMKDLAIHKVGISMG